MRSSVSPSSGKGKKGGKLLLGGNAARSWPTPAWQKGIDAFLSSPSRGKEGECSSGGSGSGSSRLEEESEEGTSSLAGTSALGVGSVLMDDGITQLGSDSEED